MATVTRTLNPLPFGDLEPHRFEDLVRQLAYDFRPWRVIEPTGRLGADEGVDIRAIEGTPYDTEEADGESMPADPAHDRVWIIQCKREKELGPTAARKAAKAGLKGLPAPPYGFVLAVACDLSRKTRESLRAELMGNGVREVYAWGKGDLEDALFLPRNDHLLFAYFGISLQVRRRTMRTELRSRLATKKALFDMIGELVCPYRKPVFLRDPTAKEYPWADDIPNFKDRPRWGYLPFVYFEPPDHLAFHAKRYWAYLDVDAGKWDTAYVCPERWFSQRQMLLPEPIPKFAEQHGRAATFWREKIPEGKKAFLYVTRFIHFDQVLAIDTVGDCIHQVPQLLVEFTEKDGPFEPGRFSLSLEFHNSLTTKRIPVDSSKRIEVFPADLRGE